MGVVRLPARLSARRRAIRLLGDGRRLLGDLDVAGAEAALTDAFRAARESDFHGPVVAAGTELYPVLLRRRRVDEAVPVARELMARHVRLSGRAGEGAAAWRNELIRRLGGLGRYAEAEALCRERLTLAREQRPPDPRAAGFATATLAWCVRGQGRWDEAERLCRDALAMLENGAPRGSDAWALVGLAAVLLRRLELDQAEAALRRAAVSWTSVGRVELARVAEEHLLDLYVVGERYPEALALSEQALGQSRRGAAAAEDRERDLRGLERHAFLLQMGGRAAEAIRYETRAGYLRAAIETERRRGDGASPDPAGPVFEGEPLLDWELPGAAVPIQNC
jgi:tetratricopeptide (TPR) repeat protein